MSDDPDYDVMQIHIEATDREFETLAQLEVDAPEGDLTARSDTRLIALTTGGDLTTEGRPFAYAANPDEKAQCTVIPDRAVAIGYFLHGLEQHEIAEDVAMNSLGEQVDLTPYHEMQASLTSKTRRLRLMDWWEWRANEGGDFAAARYFDEGATWRTKGLSESGRKLAASIARNSPVKPRQCYRTAGEAAILHENNRRISYVEGMALPTQANQAVRHSWIEIDGTVCELTWPWHQFDGGDAEYIGVEIDKEHVHETRQRRDINGAIVLTDEEVRRVGAKMRGVS